MEASQRPSGHCRGAREQTIPMRKMRHGTSKPQALVKGWRSIAPTLRKAGVGWGNRQKAQPKIGQQRGADGYSRRGAAGKSGSAGFQRTIPTTWSTDSIVRHGSGKRSWYALP
jgi:hypothetical protein